MGNASSLVDDEAPVISTPAPPVGAAKYEPRYRSHDAHHLEILVCRPFDSNEKPFEDCKIRYIKGSRFFVFDMLKNSSDITFNHVIHCVKLSYLNGLMIATNNGAYALPTYGTELEPVKGLEGQNIIDFEECFEYFLTADGNVFHRQKRGSYGHDPAVCIPLGEIGELPITKILCDTKNAYTNTSKLFLINEQNDLIVRDIPNRTCKIIKLETTSPVAQMYYFDYLYTVHKNGKVMLAYDADKGGRGVYNGFNKRIANHNIVKMDSDYGLLFFQTDKGLLLTSLYDDRRSRYYDLHNARISDFQAEPIFTYVDIHGDVLLYNKYKDKIEYMDRGTGYFSYLVNANTKVIANHDCILMYVTKDTRRRTEMTNMHKQATQTFKLIDVDIITLH